MSSCGISFDDGVVVTELSSVAVKSVNPILDTDGIAVKSDNSKLKAGRKVGVNTTSLLSYNRQVELKLSIIGSDLGALRLLYRNNGATPITIDVGRVDLFADGSFDTPQEIVILGVGGVSRSSASYYECMLRIVKK